jgi:hypothetical protein
VLAPAALSLASATNCSTIVRRQLDFPVASIKIAAPYSATADLAEADFDCFAAVAR